MLSRMFRMHDGRYNLPLKPSLDEGGRAQMVSCKGTHFPKDIVLTGSACPGQIVRFTDTLSAKRSVGGSE